MSDEARAAGADAERDRVLGLIRSLYDIAHAGGEQAAEINQKAFHAGAIAALSMLSYQLKQGLHRPQPEKPA